MIRRAGRPGRFLFLKMFSLYRTCFHYNENNVFVKSCLPFAANLPRVPLLLSTSRVRISIPLHGCLAIRTSEYQRYTRISPQRERRTWQTLLRGGIRSLPQGRKEEGAAVWQPRELIWCPQRDLNPRYRRERAVSWAGLDDGDVQ